MHRTDLRHLMPAPALGLVLSLWMTQVQYGNEAKNSLPLRLCSFRLQVQGVNPCSCGLMHYDRPYDHLYVRLVRQLGVVR